MRTTLGATLITLLLAAPSQARELFPDQYAQVDPKTRQWFRDQKVPGTNRQCCSEADRADRVGGRLQRLHVGGPKGADVEHVQPVALKALREADALPDRLIVEGDEDYQQTRAFQRMFPEGQYVVLLAEAESLTYILEFPFPGDPAMTSVEVVYSYGAVPDEAVIHDPNRNGAPVVWWGWQDKLFIRCYSPGAGI